ncbi:MAG: hypothetical protein ACFB15_29980 [Cyclobacteriaceae bacterium]
MKLTWAIIILGVLTSCGGEFIPDPLDPRLPRYSEEGKNTAGCFINSEVWQAIGEAYSLANSRNQYLQITFTTDNNTIGINIGGYQGKSVDSLNTYVELAFIIDNRDTKIQSINELEGRTFVLDGDQSFGRIIDSRDFFQYDICRGAGQLHIRYASAVPDTNDEYIIAGTFSFSVDQPTCRTADVRSGRFDYRVNISPISN